MTRFPWLNFVDVFGLRFIRTSFWISLLHLIFTTMNWYFNNTNPLWFLLSGLLFFVAWLYQRKLEQLHIDLHTRYRFEIELANEYDRREHGIKLWKKSKEKR